MRWQTALVATVLSAAPVSAEVSVRVDGDKVDLSASAAPLSDVLERLARQTGMKVVYEGPAPRQLVTVSLQGRSPAETVLALLEGLGLNFAIVAEPGGHQVQTLLLAGSAPVASTPAPASDRRATPRPTRRPFGPPPGASPEGAEPAFEEPEEEPEIEDPAFTGLPPGAEMVDPSGAAAPPDPTAVDPSAQQAPTVPPPGAGLIPTQPPAQGFSASPFTPQPQPFPPLPPGAPVPGVPPPGMPGGPPPEEGEASPPQ